VYNKIIKYFIIKIIENPCSSSMSTWNIKVLNESNIYSNRLTNDRSIIYRNNTLFYGSIYD